MIDDWLDRRIGEVRRSRDQLLAQLNAHEGALQMLEEVRRQLSTEASEGAGATQTTESAAPSSS